MTIKLTFFLAVALLGCAHGQIWIPVLPEFGVRHCFNSDFYCYRESIFDRCDDGWWQCQQYEYCEIVEYKVGDNPWDNGYYHTLTCKQSWTRQECQNKFARNDVHCDPTRHDHECTWCCDNADCVHHLAAGRATTTPPPTTQAPTAVRHCFDTHDWCYRDSLLDRCDDGRWQCQSHEYCEIVEHNVREGDSVDFRPYHEMTCKDVSMKQICLLTSQHHDVHCDPNRHDHECTWCCDDADCVHHLAAGLATTTLPPTTVAPPGEIVTGRHCFDTDSYCYLNSIPGGCDDGTWQCQAQEYCEIVEYKIVDRPSVHGFYHTLTCRQDSTKNECLTKFNRNDVYCDPTRHDHECTWCCDDADCVHHLAASRATTPLPSTTPAPTVARHCFDADYWCPRDSLLDSCDDGKWQCQANEYCEIVKHNVRDVSDARPFHELTCKDVSTMQECLANFTQNSDLCSGNGHNQECTWCCDTADCVHDLAAGITATPATTADTTLHLSSVCHDSYPGDCGKDFSGRCGESLVQRVCGHTCGAC